MTLITETERIFVSNILSKERKRLFANWKSLQSRENRKLSKDLGQDLSELYSNGMIAIDKTLEILIDQSEG